MNEFSKEQMGTSSPSTIIMCHAPKPTPSAWLSFHTSSSKAQSRNDINIRIVTEKKFINYQIPVQSSGTKF